jgi:LmbE family N-acetylglucosaminyl deacetylase
MAMMADPVPSERSAIVFAPHPDDETLGCGGTIAAKRRLGAQVTIVEMTDGAASHREIEPQRLKAIRAGEALEASTVLGVPRTDVIMLSFPDGALASRTEEATERVGAILDRLRPKEVFVPYLHDVHEDHVATNRIVRAALTAQARGVERLYEYPTWFLAHWPLFAEFFDRPEPFPKRLAHSANSARRLLCEFRSSTLMGDLVETKRAAIDCHRSQHEGGVLGTAAFLELFLVDYELFRRVELASLSR